MSLFHIDRAEQEQINQEIKKIRQRKTFKSYRSAFPEPFSVFMSREEVTEFNLQLLMRKSRMKESNNKLTDTNPKLMDHYMT